MFAVIHPWEIFEVVFYSTVADPQSTTLPKNGIFFSSHVVNFYKKEPCHRFLFGISKTFKTAFFITRRKYDQSELNWRVSG